MVHAGTHFDQVVSRAGKKAEEDFRREMGNVMYGMEKLMSKMKAA